MVCKSINSEVKFVKFKSWPYHLQTVSPWARNVSSMHLSSLLGNMKILIICLTPWFSVDVKLTSLYNLLKTVQTRKKDLLSFNYKYYYWYDCHNNQSTKHVTIFIYIFIHIWNIYMHNIYNIRLAENFFLTGKPEKSFWSRQYICIILLLSTHLFNIYLFNYIKY